MRPQQAQLLWYFTTGFNDASQQLAHAVTVRTPAVLGMFLKARQVASQDLTSFLVASVPQCCTPGRWHRMPEGNEQQPFAAKNVPRKEQRPWPQSGLVLLMRSTCALLDRRFPPRGLDGALCTKGPSPSLRSFCLRQAPCPPDMEVFKIRGPRYRPQNSRARIIRTPKKGPPIFGSSHIKTQHQSPEALAVFKSSSARTPCLRAGIPEAVFLRLKSLALGIVQKGIFWYGII